VATHNTSRFWQEILMKSDPQISKCPNTGSIKFSRNHYTIEFTAANEKQQHMVIISDGNTKTRTYASIDRTHLIELAQILLIETK
jgi:hypothetical protein